jgi:enoyl-CoA hydratase/carnithine racemase
MANDTVLVEVEDRVATLTLNRPDKLNAYTVDMGIELFTAMAELDKRDDVRAMIVTGAGRAFCAGADLSSGGDTFSGDRTWDRAADLERAVSPLVRNTPVIAAINGPAVGIGATLPLQWDFRIAADTAKIGFVFTRRGIVPEAGSTWILPRLIGLERALDIMVTGRILTAAEALDAGVVGRVVPAAELRRSALELAAEIANKTAPVAVAITRRLLWQQLMQPNYAAGKAMEDELFYWIGNSADAAEGVESFLHKRDPKWSTPLSTIPEALLSVKPEAI